MKVWVLFRNDHEWDDQRSRPMAGYSDPVTAEAAAEAMNDGCSYEEWGVAEVEVDGRWGVEFEACADVVDGKPGRRGPWVTSRVDETDKRTHEWWGRAGVLLQPDDFALPPEDRDRRPMCRIWAYGRLPHEARERALARQAELIADWDAYVVLHCLEGAFG